MSISVSCSECKQKMVDSVLEHLPACSARQFERKTEIYTIHPPTMTISFDTPEAQAEWLRNLGASSSEHLALRKLAPKRSKTDE